MKKLLIEHTSVIGIERSSLIESIDRNNGRLILRNVLLQRADAPNRNRRVYPKRILEREIKLYENKISDKKAFGELDHPMGDSGNVISLRNVCQAIIDVNWKGNEVFGDVEILNTPSGNIIREILLAGFRVGQSSRGLGSVESIEGSEDDDIVEVQEDFELLALADAVSDESTHGANMRMNEQYNREENTQTKKIDQLLREIRCELGGICNIC